jgi:hypothetical protein
MRLQGLRSFFAGPVLFIIGPALATAAVQRFDFVLTGAGASGTGFFTWEDTPDPGITISLNEVLSLELSLSGPGVVGGSTQFTLTDCTSFGAASVPDFTDIFSLGCSNTTNSLTGAPGLDATLNGNTTLTFARRPPAAVPASPTWTLALLCAALLGLAARAGRLRAAGRPAP